MISLFFFSSRRRHTRWPRDWSSDVCSSDLIREGLTAIVSVRIPEDKLQFEGQTKGRLGTSEARSAVDAVVSEQLTYFLQENPDIAGLLIKKSLKAKQAREAARKAREDARNGKQRRKRDALLSGKLTPAQSRNPKRNELDRKSI